MSLFHWTKKISEVTAKAAQLHQAPPPAVLPMPVAPPDATTTASLARTEAQAAADKLKKKNSFANKTLLSAGLAPKAGASTMKSTLLGANAGQTMGGQ